MLKHWCYFLFLAWVSYLTVSSILLFTHGFLLSRVTQTNNSTCVSYKDVPCTDDQDGTLSGNYTRGHIYQCSVESKYASIFNNINSASSVCLPQKAKVVLLIIDAFRYDFALYNASLLEPLPFQNKLPVISELLSKHPEASRLYQFIADPPTTTMQRLKALTTGSLPTFIDAGSNFATAEINEDNIIDQLVKENHNIVFMGDDTWTGLYPNRFKRSYPYPSFNVWDLDTVDNGVREHLYPELQTKDWNLLLGHFLGVDHCGHRYGPNHPEMARKLGEMDQVVRYVTTNLPEDAILYVIGDHGMTSTGDHGGESADETKAAMFVYAKKPLVTTTSRKDKSDIVKQVDLVPTLAAVLGIPIPYSSLGITILDAMPIENFTEQGIPDWKLSLFSIWSNVQQIHLYIKEYARSSNIFSLEKLQTLYDKYNVLNARVYTLNNDKDFAKFAESSREYMISLRQMCEEVWIQFDSFSMSRGLLVMFLTLFFVYMIVDGIPNDRLPEIFLSSFLVCSYLGLFATVGVCIVCFMFNFTSILLPNIYFSTGIISIFMLVMLVVQNWEIIAMNWYYVSKSRNWTDILCRIILLLCVCILFSNSFIVEEAKALMFLLMSLIVIMVFDVNKNEMERKFRFDKLSTIPFRKTIKAKALMAGVIVGILIRMSINYLRCREEQPWCASSTHNIWKPGANASKAEWAVTLVCLALLVTFSRMWLRSCGNLVGHSPTIFLARYSPTVLVVCIGGYWVLHRLPKDSKNKLLGPWQADMLALVVYTFVTLGILSVFMKPLCIYILPKKNQFAPNSDNIIPQLFRQVKGMFSETRGEHDEVPIVCGLATVYSTVFIVVGVYLTLLLALLLGDAIAPSAVLMFFVAALVLVISSFSRYEKASNIDEIFIIPSSTLLTWFIMSLYFFYATGHQPAFPNIAWEAAFVGTGGEFSHNFLPAALVMINTFGSQILFGVTLPLLLIAPFSLFVIMPSWIKKNNPNKDFSRGDILIYEKDSLMMNHAFTLSCKYILCHGIRVFASMLTATIHCRHLMVWAIFAPKLIFESIGLIVTIVSVMIGYLLLVRVNYKVDRLVKCLNKQSR